jgi:hypothetical protein
MKKIVLLLAMASISTAYASYQVVFPLHDIQFKNQTVEIFTPTDPAIGEWTNASSLYDCKDYMPNPSEYSYGVNFTQTSNNCKRDQERTIQNRQVSSITNQVSNVGVASIEKKTLVNQTDNKEATGIRYTHTMTVGSFNYGSTYYYGYFSDSYKSQYFNGFVTSTDGTLSPSTFRGVSIDHLIESDINISMRVIPDITGKPPVMTVNGKSCTLVGPNVFTAYDGSCNFNLKNFVGQTIYIDLQ